MDVVDHRPVAAENHIVSMHRKAIELLTAGLSHYIYEKENDISEGHRQLIEHLAILARSKL